MSHRAIVVDRQPDGSVGGEIRMVEPGPRGPDDALVLVAWSSINYKDALAVTGAPGVIRTYPTVAGIDAVGVIESDPPAPWSRGQAVIVTGAGLGERTDGGLANCANVPLAATVAVPDAFTPIQAAAIGTAGVTAALSVLALERRALPDGPILVTGAGGGVSGFAIALLAARGYDVVASTGRADELEDYLSSLGAARVMGRLDSSSGKPLQSQQFAGVVDCVGGAPLANAIAQTKVGGAVTACGLAAGVDLPTSVMPFILRGVDLLGIDSVGVSRPARLAAWALLAESLSPGLVGPMIDRVIGFDDVIDTAGDVLAGRIRGRVVVDTRQ